MSSFRFRSERNLSLLFVVVFLCSCGAWSQGGLAEEALIAPGAAWKYDDTGTDLHSQGWPSASDAGWAWGPAQLGYGDGDEATLISYGGDANNKYPCYYFRHSFELANPAAYDLLTLKVLRDDGCVVYLNGTEVARSNMPPGEIAYSTLASTAVGGTDEGAWYEFSVDADLLVIGPNVVAVEVHQVSATSTDVSFDLELVGEFPVPVVTLVSPPDGSVLNSTSVSFTCSATDEVGLSNATLYIGNEPQTVAFSGPGDTEDAQISANQPNTNYGSAITINVDGDNPHAHAVIKFLNLIGDAPGQVPLGSSIFSAALQINCFDSGYRMELYRLTEDWAEGEVTWNERFSGVPWTTPGADGSGSHADVALEGDCSSTGRRTFDITLFVQEWSSGGANYGIVLTDTGTDGVDFDTSESANPPVLTVTYQTEWSPVETQALSGTSDTAVFNTTLNDQEDYVWNCLVTNASGQQSWAPADFRLRIDTHAPDPPLLLAPSDGAVGVLTSPVLEVAVSDPDQDLLDVTFYGRPASGAADFTVIVLPDTQKYSLSYPDIFTSQTQWVANNASSRNILFVTHEGDIVDNWDSTTQWQRANASMSLLDDVVPYGLAPGNHDKPTDYFNVYFPYTRYEGQAWYGGHYPTYANDSNYQLFSAGDEDYIVLHVVFWPDDDVISWADSVLKDYPDRKAIITTHGFIDGSGTRYVHVMGSTQYIWDGLIVPNDNVYFVLCGHVGAECTRTDIVNGREVHQLLADYQGRANGGDGWLRIMRFVPAEDKVYVQTYSPWLNQYETDADSQFTLSFPMRDFSVIGSQTGVASGSIVSVGWSDLSLGTQYDWYVTLTDPSGRTQVGPVWRFTTTFNDTTLPLISGVDAVDVTDSTATIVWTTDEPADSLVDYGLSESYGLQESDTALLISHSIALTGLAPETTYYYQVTSKDAAGNSGSSAAQTFTTLPVNHPPVANDQSASTWEDTPVEITLTANDIDNDFLTYSIVTGPANGSLSGTLPNVTYTPNPDYNGSDSFTFEANDGKADSNVATVSITVTPVNDAPGVPQNLSATAAVATVALDWDDNVEVEGDLKGYNVYRSTTSGSYTFETPLVFVTGSAYVDNDVVNGTTYFYVVTAVDAEDLESEASAEVSATPTDTAHDAYVSQNPIVTYGVLGGDGIAGTTAASDGLVQTIMEVSNGSGGKASLQAEYWLHTTANPPEVTELVLHLHATWTALDANDPLIVSIWDGAMWEDITADIQDGSFAPETPQNYIDGAGNVHVLFRDTAPIRREKKDTLTIDLLYAYILAGPPDTDPPAVPGGLSATPGDLLVNLDWYDNGESDLAGYNVYRSETPDLGYAKINESLLTVSEYSDTGVAGDVTYYYRVSAVDFTGNESDLSGHAEAMPWDSQPGTPTGLSATPGNGTVTLQWDDNPEPDVIGYNVYRSTSPGGSYAKLDWADTSDYVDSSVTNGTTYYYVVTAVDGGQHESDFSNEASATPTESQTVHVESITMGLASAGRNWKAVATVLIHDQSESPQSGAVVLGDWYFKGNLVQTDASGTTDSSGNAVLFSVPEKAKSGDVFRFVITDVVLSGYVYDPAGGPTDGSITMP